MAENK